MPWIPQLLQKLHTEIVRKIGSLLSTTQEGREGLSDIGVNRTTRRNHRDLDRCSQLALRQPLPNRQLVLMTDASFTTAGYAILTEDDPNQKFTSVKKSYAPIAYGSGRLSVPYGNGPY